MKLKSKKLYLLLPFVIIVNLTALYLWIKLGWTNPTLIFTLMGIGTILFFFFMNQFYEYLQGNRVFIIGGTIFSVLGGLYLWINGEFPHIGIFFALMGVSILFRVVLKRKWTKILSTAICVVGAAVLILGEIKPEIKSIIGKAAEVQQEAVEEALEPKEVPSGKSLVSPGQQTIDIMNRFLTPEQREDPAFQRVMKIVASDAFQGQLDEQNPQTLQEFADLMTAHGLTEFSGIDFDKVLADAYAFAMQEYQAANPGKDPEDEDEAMAKRIGEMLKTSDPIYGIMEIMQDREIAIWITARFRGDQAALGEWWGKVMEGSESDDPASSFLAPTDFEFPDGWLSDIPSDEPAEQDPFVEPERSLSDPIPISVWEEFAVPDTENSSAATPTIEPEKVVTEMTPEPPAIPTEEELETALRERFSLERFERAMSTLERYGPEEGLRRLGADDPEVAEQVERHRSEKDREADSQ